MADTVAPDTSDIVLGRTLRGDQPVTVAPEQLEPPLGGGGSGRTAFAASVAP
ncbi:hypothetical protein [Dactylosporangium sp. NPDC048998]|uniref:hypothetical protein n=1 Tax=Dactylosporangium sp. NPDC048998 TaxID=3363976 RepID=UPI003717CEF8